jgi:hypothetical protein
MFMQAQQLSPQADTVTEFQVTQNKRLTISSREAKCNTKKILKMQDDPTISMKTQGHMTECHSQLCESEGRRHGPALLVPHHDSPRPIRTPRRFRHQKSLRLSTFMSHTPMQPNCRQPQAV